MITMHYGPLAVGEVFFRTPPVVSGVDLLRCRQMPAAAGMLDVEEQATLVIDLAEAEEILFQRVHKDARYELRRAETKDGVVCRLFQSHEINDRQIYDLAVEYDRFVQQKRITPLNLQRIRQLQREGLLFIGEAKSSAGDVLAWHVYLLAHERARLLYSLSLFRDSSDTGHRALVGRANRLLHWKDIVAFKTGGAALYDFGGYYRGNTDESKLRINRFKQDFGGEPRLEYNGLRFVSLKGRCAGYGYRIYRRLLAGIVSALTAGYKK